MLKVRGERGYARDSLDYHSEGMGALRHEASVSTMRLNASVKASKFVRDVSELSKRLGSTTHSRVQ